MKYIIIFIALFFIIGISCRVNKQQNTPIGLSSEMREARDSVLNVHLGNDWTMEISIDDTYFLGVQKIQTSPKQPYADKKYIVLNKNNEVLYKGLIHGGYVKWYSKEEIEFFNYPGVMPPNKEKEDITYIYNLINKTTFPKSKFKEYIDKN